MTDKDAAPITDPGVRHVRTAEPAGDAAIVRRVRWRLLAWSGGSTLAVLLVFGAVLYAVIDRSLAAAAEQQLRDRAIPVAKSLFAGAQMPLIDPNVIAANPGQPGLVIGGASSGTVAFVATPFSGVVPAPGPIDSLVNAGDMNAALRSGEEIIREVAFAGAPWRVLTLPFEGPGGRYVVQVAVDTSAEERTLGVLVTVLVAGGLVVMAVSLLLGWLYADRALVPIRDAMRRQREFAADASHELRTPLAIVRGTVDLLRRNRDEPVSQVGDALDDLESQTDRLTDLVDDLLVLARTDSGAVDLEPVLTDLAELVLDTTSAMAALASREGVRLEVDARPVPLTADPARLRQLIHLLVDNAIRHSAAAGEGRSVRLRVGIADGRALMTVEDEGQGIRDEDLPRVFDRFWRASNAPSGGTGLGLAIAAWIVERHGGSITASNHPAGGARFEVRLPMLADAAA
jgi:two-component system, OmpR family, sensor histidine kinase CiaH